MNDFCNNIELSASMMCADYGCLEKEIRNLEAGGIDSFHIDIMDGQFVPNFCMGIQDLRCIRRLTKKPVEVHLMIKRPMSYLKVFIDAGVDVIYVHPEADYHLHHVAGNFECRYYARDCRESGDIL